LSDHGARSNFSEITPPHPEVPAVNTTRSLTRLAALLCGATLVTAGCSVDNGSSSSGTSSSGPSTSAVATVAPDNLVRAGKLTVCMDMPFPPMQFFDDKGNPTGLDVDLATEVAKRMGLQAEPANSVFDTIIAALKSGKCDVIMADQFITPARQKEVNMLAYLKTLESFVVAKGNPKNVKTDDTLCGLKAAGQTGGAEVKLLETINTKCTGAGKKAVEIQQFPKSTDALNALRSGLVDVWVASTLTAAHWIKQSNGQFEVASDFPIADSGEVGVSFNKDVPEVEKAYKAALESMVKDGSYDKLFAKYGLDSVKLTPQVG
jgi:polar amino acid transport system substrate-binding protein